MNYNTMKSILTTILILFSIAYPVHNSLGVTIKKDKKQTQVFEYEHTPYEMLALLIKDNESLSLKAYKDVDRYSIGWGTISYENEEIDYEEANKRFINYLEKRLLNDVKEVEYLRYEDPVLYAVICDFAYNRGSLTDEIVNYIRHNDIISLKKEIKKYIYSEGKVLEGLVNRRNKCVFLIENKDNINCINEFFNNLKNGKKDINI